MEEVLKNGSERHKMVEEWMEATLTSSHDQSGITTKLWKSHAEQITE